MYVTVIVNRSCRMLAERNFGPETLEKAFSAVNVGAEIHLVEARQIRPAAERQDPDAADAVIAVGGDGTVGTVAGVLARSRIPLGVLPCGTFNHFAQDIGIPLDLGKRTTFTGGKLCLYTAACTRRVDIVRIALLAFLDRSRRQKDFHTDFVPEVLLETRRRSLLVSIDGEVLRMQPPLRYRSLPRSLQVILPADTAVA